MNSNGCLTVDVRLDLEVYSFMGFDDAKFCRKQLGFCQESLKGKWINP